MPSPLQHGPFTDFDLMRVRSKARRDFLFNTFLGHLLRLFRSMNSPDDPSDYEIRSTKGLPALSDMAGWPISCD